MSDSVELVVAEELSPRERALKLLTPAETTALAVESRAEASKELADDMYELFMRGLSCDEIRRRNPGLSLGQVVRARIQYGWDERLREYDDRLLANARAGAQRIGLESVEFISKLIAANHKLTLQHVERFLQSGNPDDLGAAAVMTVKQYRELLDTLVKLTGQDTQRVKGEVLHRVQHEGQAQAAAGTAAGGSAPGTPLSPTQAALVLRALEEG